MNTLRLIISGGQTGVDRAALDAAMDAGIPHGGVCPLGRRAEDGAVPAVYRLREAESAAYHVRTEQNVVESDGTLILYRQRLHGGTRLTYQLALKHGRPCLLLDLDQAADEQQVAAWVQEHAIVRLNVAGPRESSSPGIGRRAKRFLDCVLAR